MHAPEDILISIRVRAGASVDTVRALTGADPAGVEIKEIRAVDRTDGASVHDVLVCGAAERVSAFGDAITGLEGSRFWTGATSCSRRTGMARSKSRAVPRCAG